MKKQNTFNIIVLIICLLLAAFIIYKEYTNNNSTYMIAPDGSAVKWSGRQVIKMPANNQTGVIVPGVTEMYFVADKIEQKVNLYNPEENSCFFVFEIMIDDVCYWRSGNCAPGDGYYEIELDKEMEAGTHDGFLVVRCFTESGEQLNSAFMQTKIYASEGN